MNERALKAQESIAESLRRIADMMQADRQMLAHAQREAAEYVDPVDCDHPPEHRTHSQSGAQIRLGCSRCGVDDISKTARRSA